MALRDASRRLNKDATVGLAASTDSFYVGQERKGFRGYAPSHMAGLIADLRQSRVLCFEMESSTIFTLGRIYGLKTGALFGVVGSRITDEFRPGAGVADAIQVAIEAVRRLRDYEI
jgi:uridine phosphorylase